MDYKQTIIKSLTILRDSVKAEGNIFKTRSYDKVIKNIDNINEPIMSYDQIEIISGAGDKIKLKLKEIFQTGHLKAADEINKNPDNEIRKQLLNIHGIGPVKAEDLVVKHKIYSIAQLREESKKDSKLLTDAQKIGLKYYDDFLERIPRSEMIKHKKMLNVPSEIGEITGSFRRGNLDSGDIDVILNMNIEKFKEYIKYLENKKYLKHILAVGNSKLLGVCQLPGEKNRRLDLIRTEPEEFPYSLLYFTGSAKFNVAFRNHCLENGLSLSEHGFKPNVKGLNTEKDIFNHVGLQYIHPEKRIDISSIIKK